MSPSAADRALISSAPAVPTGRLNGANGHSDEPQGVVAPAETVSAAQGAGPAAGGACGVSGGQSQGQAQELLNQKAAEKAAAEAAYAASGGVLRTKRPPGMVKRSIAMHVGYVGTAFKGLQVNRAGAPDSTVEEVLERAVFGANLIAESNFGDLKKIKWTRNSRTDKGVHSVATVVGLRVLLPGDERFDDDPEGLQIAAELNSRLPQQVRVFSAQRAPKKFNARRFCFDRTYEYFLPAYLLLPKTSAVSDAAAEAATTPADAPPAATPSPEAGAEAEAEALRVAVGRLREALATYVGTYPFHNYTAKRKTYVDTARDREARKAARAAAAAAIATEAAAAGDDAPASAASGAGAGGPLEGGGEEDEEELRAAAMAAARSLELSGGEQEEGGAEEAAVGQAEGGARGRRKGRRKDDDDDPLEEDEETEGEGDGGSSGDGEYGGAPSSWIQSCRWLYEKSADTRDRVTVRHFRTITSFTAEDPEPLVPGGTPCVRIRVRGMSFMLHQIRHMIGGALAVARGQLPQELLRASLCAHSRVTVPRAPPHTLILADCSFPPFRKAGAEEARVARWSGERLELREGGRSNRAAFRKESLDPALNQLLGHPDWQRFEACLPRFQWDAQAQEEVIRAFTAWELMRKERARQRQAEAEAEAEAAAAGAAAATAADTAAAAAPDAEGSNAEVTAVPH